MPRIASTSAIRSRVRSWSAAAAGRTLSRFDAVPPTATISTGRGVGSAAQRVGRHGSHCVEVGARRRVAGSLATAEHGRAEPQADRPRPMASVHDAALGRAATDVDDEGLVGHRQALGHADDRQERLLLVGQDVERRPRGGLDVVDDPGGVRRATDRLRAQDGDGRRPVAAGDPGVALERGGQLIAGAPAEEPALGDRRAEPEEDGLVVDELEMVADDARDQQVDRIRAEVDGSADGRARVGWHDRGGSGS